MCGLDKETVCGTIVSSSGFEWPGLARVRWTMSHSIFVFTACQLLEHRLRKCGSSTIYASMFANTRTRLVRIMREHIVFNRVVRVCDGVYATYHWVNTSDDRCAPVLHQIRVLGRPLTPAGWT